MRRLCAGGLEGDRTLGLCVANAALSQLSYEPVKTNIITINIISRRTVQVHEGVLKFTVY